MGSSLRDALVLIPLDLLIRFSVLYSCDVEAPIPFEMLTRRLCLPAVSAMAPSAFRFTSSKKNELEDDRWLEAMIDEQNAAKTPEERYAAAKQAEVLKKMMSKLREHSEVKAKAVEDKHAQEITALKARLADLEGKK